jgi:hypothetical protein
MYCYGAGATVTGCWCLRLLRPLASLNSLRSFCLCSSLCILRTRIGIEAPSPSHLYNLCKQICSTKQYMVVLVKSPTLSSTELSTFPQEKCGSWDLSSSKPNHDLELHVVASREDSSHNLLYVRRKSRDNLCGL